jgi:L-asparaginase
MFPREHSNERNPTVAQPRIALFFTGGTISMRIDPATGGAIPMLSGAEILAAVPGLDALADLEIMDYARLPGPHWTPVKMLALAQDVKAKLDTVDGVVITHGTDTLEETAYALSLLLNSSKPVVLVGAMRNSSELSWDGPANLRAAVRVAAAPQARDLGVLVVMNEELIAAEEVTKTHTEKTDTFQSRDFGPLGLVDKDQVIVMRRPAARERIITDKIESRVEIIKMYAGADGKLIDFAVREGARGLVIEALGRGNVTPAALGAIERAIAQGVPVVITSRCPRGRVLDTYAYEGGGKQLTKAGAILGGLLPSHKARVKLMLALGAGWTGEMLREAFAD